MRSLRSLLAGAILGTLATSTAFAQPMADPAFDQFVSMAALQRAWSEKDPAQLTDVALQLAEGERVLLRPHQLFSSDDLFRLAIRTAADEGDEQTLDRLAKAVADDESLARQVAAARTLAGASRSAPEPLMIEVGDVSADDVAVYQLLAGQIRSARLAEDPRWLDAVSRVVDTTDDVDDRLVNRLKMLADDARSSMPEDAGTDAKPTSLALMQLEHASRGGWGRTSFGLPRVSIHDVRRETQQAGRYAGRAGRAFGRGFARGGGRGGQGTGGRYRPDARERPVDDEEEERADRPQNVAGAFLTRRRRQQRIQQRNQRRDAFFNRIRQQYQIRGRR